MTADAGPRRCSYLVLHHESGVTSSVDGDPGRAAGRGVPDLELWGDRAGRPRRWRGREARAALQVALAELAANARAGHPGHPCDVRFGRDVVAVLAAAEREIAR